MRKKVTIGLLVLIALSTAAVIYFLPKSQNVWSGVALSRIQNKTDTSISSKHSKLNGHGYYGILLKKGTYLFNVEIKTQGGSINFDLTKDKKGKDVLTSLNQSTKITFDNDTTAYLQISAKWHKGNYSINWKKTP